MTTEHERPADARAARDFFADHGFLDRDNAREVLRCLTAARLALAQAGPNASPAPGYLSGKLNPFPERLPATQATEIAEKLIRAYLLDIGAGMDDFTQHEVEFSEKIAAAIGAAAHASSGASALEIAERFRLFFQRPYPTSDEGVERAVQSLAQEIENTIRRGETRPGAHALEATRDLFQSLEGWRPTDDWTGVPPRLKLAFDRTLHAIEAAEARGRERL